MAAIKDFNAHHREWLSSVSPANCHSLRVFEFASEAGCEQLVCRPTHRFGNFLDLVFTDIPVLLLVMLISQLEVLITAMLLLLLELSKLCLMSLFPIKSL